VDLSRGKEGMNFSRNRTLNVNPKIFTLSRDRSAWGHYSKRVKVKGGGGNRVDLNTGESEARDS
jgi:hypothetical protein